MHFAHLINTPRSAEINCTDMLQIIQQTSAQSYFMCKQMLAPISKPFQSDIRERQIFNEFRGVARSSKRSQSGAWAKRERISIKDISHSRNEHTRVKRQPTHQTIKCEQKISGFVESFKVIHRYLCAVFDVSTKISFVCATNFIFIFCWLSKQLLDFKGRMKLCNRFLLSQAVNSSFTLRRSTPNRIKCEN